MLIDAIIGFFSPRAGFNRIRYREATKTLGNILRAYEGAAKGRRTDGWHTAGSSANTELRGALSTLRNRSRDLIRNNPYAKRAATLVATNVVGKGIRANFYSKVEGRKKQYAEAWDTWATTTACDYEGRKNLYGIQRMAMEGVFESGEILIRRRTVQGKIPLKLQVLESDFINSNMFVSGDSGKNRIFQGIEIDGDGKVVAYHLYESHPGDIDSRLYGGGALSLKTVRVPASEIIHLFLEERPGQIRGVPWLSPVMIKLRDFDDYEDAQLVRQKIAACFSVFISDTNSDDCDTAKANQALGEKVEPGIIEMLPPGKSVTMSNPPGVQNYAEYSTCILMGISTGLGLSYEALTGDLSRVNFSSARMGWIEFQRNIDTWRECVMNTACNERVLSWFLEASMLVGMQPKDVYAQWIAPRREMIDPTKEVPARVAAIRAGLESLEDSIFQNGKDPKEHLEQIAKTNETLDGLGLILDCDPRKVDNSGKLSSQDSTNPDDNETNPSKLMVRVVI